MEMPDPKTSRTVNDYRNPILAEVNESIGIC
jgi:hypothetical protein